MLYRQKYAPNVGTRARRGWCLEFIDNAGSSPLRSRNARTALNMEAGAGRLNVSTPPLGVWVVGFLDLRSGQWAADDHVFLMKYLGGGRYDIRDSESNSGARGIYSSVKEILAWFGAYAPAYAGWSTHCDGRQYAEAYTPQPTKPPGGTVYVVKRGDTLSSIAAKYKTTWQKLASFNSIKNPNVIMPGQKIKIPVAKPVQKIYYTVRAGDTLYGIALKYKTTVAKIAALNKIKNVNLIYKNQKLMVK